MNNMFNVFLILFSFLGLIFVLFSIRSLISAAPFIPMRAKHLKNMMMLAEPKAGEFWLDLGSGDGRIVFEAAKQGIRAKGIELNPLLYYYTKIKLIFSKNKELISFSNSDLWKADVSNVDVLSIFFIKDKMPQLKKKLQNEMKPGSRIVSHIFQFPNWQYKKKNGSMYLYIVE